MQATNTRPRFEPTADAHGICSHAGVVLLAELAHRLGLTSELGRRANCGLARPGGGHAHDRGAALRDLVVMLADGGDCLSDLASLREQAGLFGRVCSTPTAWRVVHEVAADLRGWPGCGQRWRGSVRGRGRPVQCRWSHCASTLTPPCWTPTPTSRRGRHVQAHPLVAWLDRGDGTGEALAGILRPGNAGNTAQDHTDVLAMALLALPKPTRAGPILVRADTAGATHAFVNDLTWSAASSCSRSSSRWSATSKPRSWPSQPRPQTATTAAGCQQRRGTSGTRTPSCGSNEPAPWPAAR